MSEKVLPLLWQGALFDPSGYSEESRAILYACHAEGIAVVARDWPTWGMRVDLPAARRALLEEALARPEPAAPYVEAIHKTILPASRAILYPEKGPTVLRTMFETDSLPEVWVPTRFNVETFAGAGVPPHKLRVLPETFDFELFSRALDPLELPEQARGVRFLSAFELSERKGWRLLLDAWADAFSPLDDVSLVIKCSGLVMRQAGVRRRIESYVGERRTAPIVVIEEHLSAEEMVRLYRACSAFVLPSRGEGWGRPLMEAMAIGLPTAGPNWGGSLAFMTEQNSFLLEGAVVPVVPGDLVFERYTGQRWFEPDRDSLVRVMRAIAEGGEEIGVRAARGRREIREQVSWPVIAARVAELTAGALETA